MINICVVQAPVVVLVIEICNTHARSWHSERYNLVEEIGNIPDSSKYVRE